MKKHKLVSLLHCEDCWEETVKKVKLDRPLFQPVVYSPLIIKTLRSLLEPSK